MNESSILIWAGSPDLCLRDESLLPIHNLNFKPHILTSTPASKTLLITAKMAATASSTNVSSFTAVLNLYRTVSSRAPINYVARPVMSPKSEVDVTRYFDEAIGLLSTATNNTYVDRDITDHRIDHIQDSLDTFQPKVDKEFQYVHKRFDQVDGRFEKVDGRFEKVDGRLEKVDRRLEQIDGRLDKVECHLEALKSDMNKQFGDMNKQFGQNLAFQRNRLVRLLEAQIERIAEPKEGEMGGWRNEVADEFPTTVWRFWSLKSNGTHKHHHLPLLFSQRPILNTIAVSALQQLAKHYSVKGWEDWKMMDSGDSGATQYHCLNDAVTAHPGRCLRALAVKWGLEYGQLQTLQVQPQAPKRKADDSETESRRVRFKQASEVETEVSILSSDSRQAVIQKRTKTSAEATVPINTTLEAVLMEYGHVPGHINRDEESAEVRWSDSSTRARRHRFRAISGGEPPALSDRV